MRKKFPETFCLLKVSTGGCDPARRTASAAFPACRAASSTTPGVMLAEVFVGLPEEERKIAVVSLRVSAPVAALPALRTVVVTLVVAVVQLPPEHGYIVEVLRHQALS
jgi:hypothetical protein